MKIETISDLLDGNFEDVPELSKNLVRIFISSTFTGNVSSKILITTSNKWNKFLDTQNERDYLIEHVFPKLKDYCKKKYDLTFQVCVSKKPF